MKTTLTLLLLSFSLCYSADYYFHYDGAGNRERRTVTLPPGFTPPGGGNETEETILILSPSFRMKGRIHSYVFP